MKQPEGVPSFFVLVVVQALAVGAVLSGLCVLGGLLLSLGRRTDRQTVLECHSPQPSEMRSCRGSTGWK
jgi:hypothetical protein